MQYKKNYILRDYKIDDLRFIYKILLILIYIFWQNYKLSGALKVTYIKSTL